MHDHANTRLGQEMLDRSLEHQRRPGHRIDDRTLPSGGLEEPPGDLPVHVGEGVGSLVLLVEAHRGGHRFGTRVAKRAEISM